MITIPQELAYDNTVEMTAHGETFTVDVAVAMVVHLLNRVPNVRTTSSCAGHDALMEASILFRAADGNNDALMATPFVRALATRRIWPGCDDGQGGFSRCVTRRLHGDPQWDDLELTFRGSGETIADRYTGYCQERDAILRLCEQYALPDDITETPVEQLPRCGCVSNYADLCAQTKAGVSLFEAYDGDPCDCACHLVTCYAGMEMPPRRLFVTNTVKGPHADHSKDLGR